MSSPPSAAGVGGADMCSNGSVPEAELVSLFAIRSLSAGSCSPCGFARWLADCSAVSFGPLPEEKRSAAEMSGPESSSASSTCRTLPAPAGEGGSSACSCPTGSAGLVVSGDLVSGQPSELAVSSGGEEPGEGPLRVPSRGLVGPMIQFSAFRMIARWPSDASMPRCGTGSGSLAASAGPAPGEWPREPPPSDTGSCGSAAGSCMHSSTTT